MFNPANFNVNATAQARMDRAAAPTAVNERGDIPLLLKAAAYYDASRSDFCQGKGDTCRDLAAKLDHFGTYVSTKQAEYARKLIGWAQPKTYSAVIEATVRPPAPVVEERKATTLPKLFDLMQRLSKLTIGSITIARKNQDSLCWIKLEGVEKVVGKITDGGVVVLFARQGVDQPDLLSRLASIEQDPEAAAVRHGKASGRCSICSRDLTDPESIERGIGPICAGKF